MPIIRYLLDAGHRVTAAGNSEQQQFLRRIFPAIPWVDLEGYNVHYGTRGSNFFVNMLRQLPRLTRTIRAEHKWLADICSHQQFDGIISDNRYGLHHSSLPCIILTHQLAICTGAGALADRLLLPLHYFFLQKFRAVWVVDEAGSNNLAGKLAHPARLPRNTSYAGLLSQLSAAAPVAEKHLLVLLSGPEPQRSMLEEILWQQALTYKGKLVFVSGKSTATPPAFIPAHIEYHTQLAASALQPYLEAASYVICRSGYSTLMDLALLRRKAILIPTPGQAEQEYLATHLQQQGIFPFYQQDDFRLEAALNNAKKFPFHAPVVTNVNTGIGKLLENWLESFE